MRTFFVLIGAILILAAAPALLQADTLWIHLESTTGHTVSGRAAVEVKAGSSWYTWMADNYRYDGNWVIDHPHDGDDKNVYTGSTEWRSWSEASGSWERVTSNPIWSTYDTDEHEHLFQPPTD